MTDPKFKTGEEVSWKGQDFVIQAVRNYQDYCWVYDFLPTGNTIVPFHFTGIAESEIKSVIVFKELREELKAIGWVVVGLVLFALFGIFILSQVGLP